MIAFHGTKNQKKNHCFVLLLPALCIDNNNINNKNIKLSTSFAVYSLFQKEKRKG